MAFNSLTIRVATPCDADQIAALVIQLSEPFYTSPTRDGSEPFRNSISADAQRRNLSAANFLYHVAESHGQLAGLVALRDTSHLFHLFVRPTFQHRGLARRLWNVAKSQAVIGGNQGIFTVNASLNAVPVYERFGFFRTGQVQQVHGIAFQPMVLHLNEESQFIDSSCT